MEEAHFTQINKGASVFKIHTTLLNWKARLLSFNPYQSEGVSKYVKTALAAAIGWFSIANVYRL